VTASQWLATHGWQWFGVLMLVGCPSAMLLLWIVTVRRERREHEAWLAHRAELRAAGVCTVCEGTGYEQNERRGVCWACRCARELGCEREED
jgi:hypothetical protein